MFIAAIASVALLSSAFPMCEPRIARFVGVFGQGYDITHGHWKEAEEYYKSLGKSLKYPVSERDSEDVLSLICRELNNPSHYGNVMTGIRWCIERGADVNSMGGRPLWMAARTDKYQKGLMRLLEYGANPNLQPIFVDFPVVGRVNGTLKYEKKTYKTSSILVSAIEGRNSRNVEILLKHKVDPNKLSEVMPIQGPMDGKLHTPLGMAAKNGMHDAVAMLVRSGAKINAKEPVTGYTALHHAVLAQQEKCVEALLKLKANKNLKDAKGKTPLGLARTLPNKKIVRLLS